MKSQTRSSTWIHLDLSCLASVKSAVDEILNKNWRVNVLILNAGVFAPSVESTVDGYESTWAVNHLAHFYLLLLLLPMLRSSSTKPSRVVFVSSTSHKHSAINGRSTTEEKLRQLVPSIKEERRTNGLSSYRLYARSKLCNILTAKKLHRIEQGAEKNETTSGIRVYSLHPGSMMATDISRSYGFLGRAFMYLMKPFTKDLKQGAATTVYFAVHPDVDQESGRYFEGCCGDEKNLSIDLANDEALQDALWQYSVDLLRSANLIDDTIGH